MDDFNRRDLRINADVVFAEGGALHVRYHPDDPYNAIELCTVTQAALESFGRISIALTKSQALALAGALNAVAETL